MSLRAVQGNRGEEVVINVAPKEYPTVASITISAGSQPYTLELNGEVIELEPHAYYQYHFSPDEHIIIKSVKHD